jgi:predicted amidohydrolase YtcJ
MTSVADTIFTNGQVITVDPHNMIAEAVAVMGNRVAAVGSATKVAALRGPETKVVDLTGRTLLPGFIEAHAHLGIYGIVKSAVQCGPPHVKSIADLQAAIKERAQQTPQGEWIRGWGYNNNELDEGRHPTRWDLDVVVPDQPAFVMRTCAHIAVLNSKALALIGIDNDTPDPKGGKLDRENGVITGVLREEARRIAWEKAAPTAQELESAIAVAVEDLNRYGITSIHDMAGYGAPQMQALIRLTSRDPLRMRVIQVLRAMYGNDTFQDPYLTTGLMTGFGNERLRLGAMKYVVDGASSARTMATYEPPISEPDNTGILYVDQDELNESFSRANSVGFQVTAHAMGDKAVDMCINAIEYALSQHPRGDHRHRIEHCALTNEAMVDRIADLGIVPVANPVFIWTFGDVYARDYGEERAGRMFQTGLYAKKGVRCPYTSDAPIVSPDPLMSIEMAVTRRTKGGRVLGPDERVDLMQAIRAHTIDAAYAGFEEGIKGSIEPGRLADLVVLSGDIMAAPAEEIRNLMVDVTMLDGNIVYERNQ